MKYVSHPGGGSLSTGTSASLMLVREIVELLIGHFEMLGLETLFTLQRPPNRIIDRRLGSQSVVIQIREFGIDPICPSMRHHAITAVCADGGLTLAEVMSKCNDSWLSSMSVVMGSVMPIQVYFGAICQGPFLKNFQRSFCSLSSMALAAWRNSSEMGKPPSFKSFTTSS